MPRLLAAAGSRVPRARATRRRDRSARRARRCGTTSRRSGRPRSTTSRARSSRSPSKLGRDAPVNRGARARSIRAAEPGGKRDFTAPQLLSRTRSRRPQHDGERRRPSRHEQPVEEPPVALQARAQRRAARVLLRAAARRAAAGERARRTDPSRARRETTTSRASPRARRHRDTRARSTIRAAACVKPSDVQPHRTPSRVIATLRADAREAEPATQRTRTAARSACSSASDTDAARRTPT